jgi:hypothetical protein
VIGMKSRVMIASLISGESGDRSISSSEMSSGMLIGICDGQC